SGEGSFQGQLAFRGAALTIPDSPPLSFDEAYVICDSGHVRLSPAVVHTADLLISTESMKVASLRSQVALAAVPWLEQLKSGHWSGELHYHGEPAPPVSQPVSDDSVTPQSAVAAAGWTGRLQLTDAETPLPGLADPVQLATA